MATRIYGILLMVTIVTGIVFYFFKENVSEDTLWVILILLSIFFVASIHGIVAHTLNPQLKGGLIMYPVFMGILYALLFFLYSFLIVPLFFLVFFMIKY